MWEELKWPAVAIAFGLLLAFYEWNLASKKKGGPDATDWKKVRGIVGVSLAIAALIWALIKLA